MAATDTTQTARKGGYSATKDQLLKRMKRIEGHGGGTPQDMTDELMAAVGRLMRRG